jgi:Alpha/beta hydrolase family
MSRNLFSRRKHLRHTEQLSRCCTGWWGDPVGFHAVIKELEQRGNHALVVRLPRWGCEPPNKAVLDAIQEVHDKVKELMQSGNNVTVVVHSAGGFIAPEGLKGLLASDLSKSGKAGGVTSLVYVSARCMSVGEEAPPARWFQYAVSNIARLAFDDDMTYNGYVRGDYLWVNSPQQTLYSDLTDMEANAWTKRLKHHPAHY